MADNIPDRSTHHHAIGQRCIGCELFDLVQEFADLGASPALVVEALNLATGRVLASLEGSDDEARASANLCSGSIFNHFLRAKARAERGHRVSH